MKLHHIIAFFAACISVACFSVRIPVYIVEPTVTATKTPNATPVDAYDATFTSIPPETSASNEISSTSTELPEQINEIALHYYYESNFFPTSWLREPPSCIGRQFDFEEAPRVISDIEEFISAYDAIFLRQNLTDIYLLNELKCYGQSFGGTNSSSSVYLVVRTQGEGFTDQFLVSMLHSEFSSILMRNYPFPEQEWRLINQDSFVYSENAVQVVEQDTIREQTEDLFEAGFLTRYATTSVENDFNMIVEWLFTQGTELCEIRSQYERINRKAELAIEFYATIDTGVEFSTCN